MAFSAGELPDPPLLAMLDTDQQGWVLARSVREHGVIVDFELIYINEVSCRIVDRPARELVGRRYRELWPETVHDGTLPLYCGVVENSRCLERCTTTRRRSPGHFEMTISPYGDGFGVRSSICVG